MARAMKNWANVILLAVQVLGPVFSKLGKKKVDKFQSANREAQIKMVRRWAIVSPPLWVALKNKKAANRVVDFLTSEEGKEIIASGGEAASKAAKAKLTKKRAKKNSRARRNHHLVVGERVKLSARGMDTQPITKAPGWREAHLPFWPRGAKWFRQVSTILHQMQGTVRKVDSRGYVVHWDGNPKQEVGYYGDKDLVSVSSTSRNWPGDHYEGIPPKRKRNIEKSRSLGFLKDNPHRELDVGDVVKWSPSYLDGSTASERKRQEKWRGTIVGLRMRSDPLWGYDVETVNPHGLTYELQAKTEEVVPANPRGFRVKTSHHFDRAPKDNPMRKNPKARRNHHLIVGEKVKWSTAGLRLKGPHRGGGYAGLRKPSSQDRGNVVQVFPDGYGIIWEESNDKMATGTLLELLAERPPSPNAERFFGMDIDDARDKDVVAADSTTTKWPGNRFEGVDPMAKKNPKHFKVLAGRVRDYLDDHPGASFDEAFTHAMAGCREAAEWGMQVPRAMVREEVRLQDEHILREGGSRGPTRPRLSSPRPHENQAGEEGLAEMEEGKKEV